MIGFSYVKEALNYHKRWEARFKIIKKDSYVRNKFLISEYEHWSFNNK